MFWPCSNRAYWSFVFLSDHVLMGLFLLILCGMTFIKMASVFGKNLEELYRKIFKKFVMFLEAVVLLVLTLHRKLPYRIWHTYFESCSPLSLPASVSPALWLPAAVLLHVHVFVSVSHSSFHFLLLLCLLHFYPFLFPASFCCSYSCAF